MMVTALIQMAAQTILQQVVHVRQQVAVMALSKPMLKHVTMVTKTTLTIVQMIQMQPLLVHASLLHVAMGLSMESMRLATMATKTMVMDVQTI
jgi:hypothetical protein